MSDIWGLRCRMFRGAYGRSCMRLVLIYHIFERLLTSCPLCTSIFIPTMKYKSIFHHPILSHHSHSHPFQSSSKNIFITMSDSSSSSTLKSTIDHQSKPPINQHNQRMNSHQFNQTNNLKWQLIGYWAH